MYGMNFNGVKKPYVVTLRGKRRPSWAPLEHDLVEIPGMPGAYLGDTKIKPRPLSVPIMIESKNLEELETMKEDLADWLITDEPKELIFDDEPNRMYYAKVEGSLDIETIVRVGVGIISFTCLDPNKYAVTKSTEVVENPSEPVVLINSGTTSTAPIFDITLKEKTTHLDIIGSKDYMRIGKPPSVEATTIDPKQIILWDQMNSLSGWVRAQNADIDGGVVVAGMQTNGYSFFQTNYGVGESWHGDALIKSIGETLTDFEVEIALDFYNTDPKTVGRVELYLLDSTKKCVGKLSLKDTSIGQDGNYAELRAGDRTTGKYLMATRGSAWYTWVNFKGVLRLSRIGNKWSAYVGLVSPEGVHSSRASVEFIDSESKYVLNPSHVLVHVGVNGAHPPAPMFVTDLKVYKLNNVPDGQNEYIGDTGDKFTFNHKTNLILKNGEPFMKKDFGARFFPLYKGNNILTLEPSNAIGTFNAEWRNAYK